MLAELKLAIRYGKSLEWITRLLDCGAPIMARDRSSSALNTAVSKRREDIVSLLLSRGADINMVANDKFGTALAAATYTGNISIVSLLLNQGADINIMGGKYGTALVAAVFGGTQRTKIVSLLLDRGAAINTVGGRYGTALFAATLKGYRDIVSLLLDRGAYINGICRQYGTELALAAFYGNMNVVEPLLDGGADINMVGGKYGTALAAAVFKGNRAMILLLLYRGANVNTVGGEYGTALATAAFQGNESIMSLLLDLGADVSSVGGEYGTALAVAAFRGEESAVSWLLAHGANINQVVDGKYGTALGAAAFGGNSDIMLLLLSQGANINMVGGKYGTALGVASFGHMYDMVSLLMDHGADLNLAIGRFGTILGLAIYQGKVDTTSLLVRRGADVMHIGGRYSTTSGVYPSALDVLHSEGSRADATLLALLTTTISKLNGPTTDAGLVDNATSWPPFPMPYTRPHSTFHATHHRSTLLSSIKLEFCASDNIAPEQADFPCQGLDERVIWHSLAALVGLSENTTQAKHHWIQNDVRYFVACNYDLGLAYAAARVAWKHFNEPSVDCSTISIHRAQWHKHVQVLDEARSKAIKIELGHSSSLQVQQELITSPYSIMPRRLWDLKSNRVVDFRMLHAAQSAMLPGHQPTIKTRPTFWAVTHSWTRDMSPVWTAINQRQWPVPLPRNISLESLRSELLTLGAEYVWIDVLCLRQQSEIDYLENLREKEWKLDVPTIGNIYRAAANIVRYFNGLGVHFSNQDWDSPRHWLQRAWTLQEIAAENTTINGGIPRDRGKVFLNLSGEVSGKVIKLRSALRPVLQLAAQVDSLHGCEVYELAREMSRRHATQEVDKLSGLFYLLRTTKLPCYDARKTSEEVWKQCFYLLPLEQKAEILLNFPYRGSEEQWFPTWAQVLNWPVRDPEYDHLRSWISLDFIKTSENESLFIRNIWTLPNAVLVETDSPSEYEVKINNWLFGFYHPYLSQEPIHINIEDHSVFTLVTTELGHAFNWLVCKTVDRSEKVGTGVNLGVAEFKVLKKVGVIRTDASSELLVNKLLQRVDCLFV